MIHATIIGIIAVIFAYLARYRNFKYGLEAAFVVIFVFLAIRYDWGNDYMGYMDAFDRINSQFGFSTLGNISVDEEHVEHGWMLLCLFCKPIGFWGMVIILSFMESFILYKLIKQYTPVNWYWLSIFIYVFTPHFMLVGASAMRQFLAMSIFIYSIKYIIEGRSLRFILAIAIAATIHTSALVLLPTYFLRNLITSKKDLRPIIFIGLIAASLFSTFLFNNIVNLGIFNRYASYMQSNIDLSYGLGFLFNICLFLTTLYYYQIQRPEVRLLFIISFLVYLLIPLYSLAPIIARIAFYFSILSIVVYPITFHAIRSTIPKIFILIAYIGFTCMTYILFFQSEVWVEKYWRYQTIFSTPGWY